jgi:hypothetical protein
MTTSKCCKLLPLRSRVQSCPPSTGQVVPRTLAEEVIAANQKLAPSFGYRVEHDGSFTDPVSGITIQQGYVPAAPDYIIPKLPATEVTPPQAVNPQSWGQSTLKIFVWGQSLAANAGYGRYAERNADKTFVYANGNYYPCIDPIAGAEGGAAAVCGRDLRIPYWAVQSIIRSSLRLSSDAALCAPKCPMRHRYNIVCASEDS